MKGWLVREEKRFIGFAQLLPGIPLVLYGLAFSDEILRTTLVVMASAVSVFGLVRVGLIAWRLARGLAPLPPGVALISRPHLLARTVLPLLALYVGVSLWGVLGSGDPRTLLGFLGLFMVFDGAINLGQAAIVADWERRNPARLVRADHLLYFAR
jgi:hypothetical protein